MAQAEAHRTATALLLLLISLSSAFGLRTHEEVSLLDPLPSSLAALNSSLGIQTLLAAQASGFAVPYWQLAVAYTTQETQAMCSIASSTMALNAAHVRRLPELRTRLAGSAGELQPVSHPPRRPLQIKAPVDPVYAPHAFYTQDDVLAVACVHHLFNKTYIDTHGLTLDQITKIWSCFTEVTAKAVHAGESSLDAFRARVRNITSATGAFMLVNFYRKSLAEEGGGHFSPLAAYDPPSDQVLIMDVARYKYPPFWVKLDELFDALNTIDPSATSTRGWLEIIRN